AEALGKPAIGVSNLQALSSLGVADLRAVWIDARREEIYGAVYDAAGALISPEVVTRYDAWRATLPAGAEVITASDPPRPLAAAIARIAAVRLASGDPGDPAAIDANYVRRSDAELFWRDPTGSPSPRSK